MQLRRRLRRELVEGRVLEEEGDALAIVSAAASLGELVEKVSE